MLLFKPILPNAQSGPRCLAEMQEFAGFPAATKRYVCRSLDIAFDRCGGAAQWSLDPDEAPSVQDQALLYERLDSIRAELPDELGLAALEPVISPLISLTLFDLNSGKIPHFGAYRFLYERLLGAAARPWLPGAYCAAFALPQLHPRRRLGLLQSIEIAEIAAPGWSIHEPIFFPEWADEDAVASIQ